jgi:hypothetical protein
LPDLELVIFGGTREGFVLSYDPVRETVSFFFWKEETMSIYKEDNLVGSKEQVRVVTAGQQVSGFFAFYLQAPTPIFVSFMICSSAQSYNWIHNLCIFSVPQSRTLDFHSRYAFIVLKKIWVCLFGNKMKCYISIFSRFSDADQFHQKNAFG